MKTPLGNGVQHGRARGHTGNGGCAWTVCIFEDRMASPTGGKGLGIRTLRPQLWQ